jgi:hypothetical protein
MAREERKRRKRDTAAGTAWVFRASLTFESGEPRPPPDLLTGNARVRGGRWRICHLTRLLGHRLGRVPLWRLLPAWSALMGDALHIAMPFSRIRR